MENFIYGGEIPLPRVPGPGFTIQNGVEIYKTDRGAPQELLVWRGTSEELGAFCLSCRRLWVLTNGNNKPRRLDHGRPGSCRSPGHCISSISRRFSCWLLFVAWPVAWCLAGVLAWQQSACKGVWTSCTLLHMYLALFSFSNVRKTRFGNFLASLGSLHAASPVAAPASSSF